MSVELESIDDYCGTINIGGLKTIQYIPVSWISNFPDFVNDQYEITDAITLIPGKQILTAKVLLNSLEFNEDQDDSKQGRAYTQEVNGIIPNWTPLLAQQFNLMKDHRFIIIVSDKEDQERIIGTPLYPLRFSSSLKTGKTASNLKHTSIQFIGQRPDKAYGYNV